MPAGRGGVAGAPALGRATLRWLLSLDLAAPLKSLRRYLSSGLLVAEVLSRYFPSEVSAGACLRKSVF